MKKLIVLATFMLVCLPAFSQEISKIKFETGIGAGWEPDYGMPGINVYNTVDFKLNPRFSISANLGFFQSMFVRHGPANSSFLTFDTNLNTSILRLEKSNFIISLGLSYILGALSYQDGSIIDVRQNVDYFNNIGVNGLLKYVYQISERLSGNISVRTYFADPTGIPFPATFSSITYGLSYSF